MRKEKQKLKEIKEADKKYKEVIKRGIKKVHENNKKVLDSFFSRF